MSETGRVAAVVRHNLGDELDGAHSSPTSTLTVLDAADFLDDGGKLSINGDVLDYLSTDGDTVITLAAPYAGAVVEATRVDVWPLSPEETWHVQVAGQDDSYPCDVPPELQGLIAGG